MQTQIQPLEKIAGMHLHFDDGLLHHTGNYDFPTVTQQNEYRFPSPMEK